MGRGLARAKVRVHRQEATPPPQGDSGEGTEVWQPHKLAAEALGLLSLLSSNKGLRSIQGGKLSLDVHFHLVPWQPQTYLNTTTPIVWLAKERTVWHCNSPQMDPGA